MPVYIQGKNLPAKDLNGLSDPFVKISLLPDTTESGQKLQTKVQRKTLNPFWNESFYFEGFSPQKLQSRVLHLVVVDHDRFSRNDSIGEIYIPLYQVSYSMMNKKVIAVITEYYNLRLTSLPKIIIGENFRLL